MTVKDAMRLLGGYAAAAEVADVSYEAACNWVRSNRFPPRTYVAFKRLLAERGATAPDELWNMVHAPETPPASDPPPFHRGGEMQQS